MRKANQTAVEVGETTRRITRAQAKALGLSGDVLPSSRTVCQQDQKQVISANLKRSASDESKRSISAAGLQRKRRAVLKDVTNTFDDISGLNCTNATKSQSSRQSRRGSQKNWGTSLNVCMAIPSVKDDTDSLITEKITEIAREDSQLVRSFGQNEKQCSSVGVCEYSVADTMILTEASEQPAEFEISQTIAEDKVTKDVGDSLDVRIVHFDLNSKDPQLCNEYAGDIYDSICVTEHERRPFTTYMEKVQHDITSNMRGILIDWLVEVSEEYKLVPDTLYLTVNIIDRFLSQSYIEKHRLQLLGVTCMLIASKYEEICAPRVEDFCLITDNTYTRQEVVKMERRVLNLLHFKLSVPTTKTFLRRFIQAAQASYKVPRIELEFLANYLAELTLVEYSFLKYLPSLVAASCVFLARWTLNQSDHPWSPALEHYTNYVTPELKTTVLALEDLQLNTSGCSLNAIREKYRQQKFRCVATLTSSKPVQSLF